MGAGILPPPDKASAGSRGPASPGPAQKASKLHHVPGSCRDGDNPHPVVCCWPPQGRLIGDDGRYGFGAYPRGRQSYRGRRSRHRSWPPAYPGQAPSSTARIMPASSLTGIKAPERPPTAEAMAPLFRIVEEGQGRRRPMGPTPLRPMASSTSATLSPTAGVGARKGPQCQRAPQAGAASCPPARPCGLS